MIRTALLKIKFLIKIWFFTQNHKHQSKSKLKFKNSKQGFTTTESQVYRKKNSMIFIKRIK